MQVLCHTLLSLRKGVLISKHKCLGFFSSGLEYMMAWPFSPGALRNIPWLYDMIWYWQVESNINWSYIFKFLWKQAERFSLTQNWWVEKEMVTHSSILAWRIPGTEEPGGLQSMGSHRVGHDWSDLEAFLRSILEVTCKKQFRVVLQCMDVRVGLWRRLGAEELMLLNYGVGEDSSESLGLQDQINQF